jgi:CHASE2 domain-containing sensor protein
MKNLLKTLLLVVTTTLLAPQSHATIVLGKKEIVSSTTEKSGEHKSQFQQIQEQVYKAILLKKLKGGKGASMDKTLYIILAIINLGWIGIGVNTDWQGSDWIIALAISVGCWVLAGILSLFIPFIPILLIFGGIIYPLMKMKDYY